MRVRRGKHNDVAGLYSFLLVLVVSLPTYRPPCPPLEGRVFAVLCFEGVFVTRFPCCVMAIERSACCRKCECKGTDNHENEEGQLVVRV